MSANGEKKLKISTIIYSLMIVVLACLTITGVLIYGLGMKNRITDLTVKYIPYPAVIIGYANFISINDINNNVQSVKNFYENQDFSKVGLRVDFSTEDGKKRLKIREKDVLNKMIEDKVIEILAKKNGIKITKEEINQAVSRKAEDYGSNEEVVRENIAKLGWTIDYFKDKMVRASLYSEELEKIFKAEEENSDRDSREKIEKAKGELEGKIDFDEVAKKYSEGSTAQEGGEMGWYKKDQLIPVLASEVFSIGTGKRSDIIESELGFHIAEVEEKKTENSEDLIRFRQIFVRKVSFADWLGEKMKDFKIWIPLKDYYWDSESLTAEFKNEDLREFEKNLWENSQGDASIIY